MFSNKGIFLGLLVVTALFPHNKALQSAIHATALTVFPLWDVLINDTQPCRFEERNYSLSLHGSAHQTCSLQVNTSQEYHARFEIPGARGR